MESQTQQILGIITILLMLVLVAPNVLRLNMALGSTMRNIAIWLLIFVGLLWAYDFIYPQAQLADAPNAIEAPADGLPASGPEADNSTRF